jgi:hypothetical protein
MIEPDRWGVPDWHEGAEYCTRRARTGREWAWEFLRRNHSYRDFWELKVKPYINSENGWIGYSVDGVLWPYHSELVETFGLDIPSDPANGGRCYFVDGWIRSAEGRHDERAGIDGAFVELAVNEVAFVLDLGRPLDKQLAGVNRIARERQQKKIASGEVDLKRSRQSQNYIPYLRLLDARDANASRRRIEEVLFSQLDNEYPDRKRSKAFDNFERAARRLRDGAYRELAAT